MMPASCEYPARQGTPGELGGACGAGIPFLSLLDHVTFNTRVIQWSQASKPVLNLSLFIYLDE